MPNNGGIDAPPILPAGDMPREEGCLHVAQLDLNAWP